jgi:hypothetical protein
MVKFFDNRLGIAVSPDPWYIIKNTLIRKIKEICPPPIVAYPNGPSPDDDNLQHWECLSDFSHPRHRAKERELKGFLYGRQGRMLQHGQGVADLLRKVLLTYDSD